MSFRSYHGYTVSEAGWRICDRNECDIPRIAGLSMVQAAALRKGPPLTILGAWLKYYDTHIEEISSTVWGWSLENDVDNSNHLAGVAVDINAPKYPWGSRTMPADRIAKVREGLRLFEGSVFWGADWDRADEMHYQCAWPEGDPRNDKFAAKLLAGHLGIYGSGSPTPTGMTSMWDIQFKNFLGKLVSYGTAMFWVDRRASEIWDQLMGPDGKGWKILGKSSVDPNRDATLVEGIAQVKAELAEIRALMEKR